MSNISLRFMTVAFVAITLTACEKKDEGNTEPPKAAETAAQNMKNVKIENNQTNCMQIEGMSSTYKENVAGFYKVSVDSVSFIRPQWNEQINSCSIVVDTPKGPNDCGVLDILKKGDEKPFAHSFSGAGC